MRCICLLALFFNFSLSLAAFQYSSGVFYPGGLTTNFKTENDVYKASLGLYYDSDELKLENLSFVSENISCGPLISTGLLKRLERSESLIEREENSAFSVDKERNIESNLGVKISFPHETGGVAARRKSDFSQGTIWFDVPGMLSSEIFFAQSFSFNESDSLVEDWYPDESLIFSRIISHSLISLILNEGDVSGGGLLMINLSEADRGGYGMMLSGAVEKKHWQFQSELSWMSHGFLFADFESPDYPFDIKSELSIAVLPVSLRGDMQLAFSGSEFFCEVGLNSKYERDYWELEGNLETSFQRQYRSALLPAVSLSAGIVRLFDRFFWSIGGSGSYKDELYTYSLELESGVDAAPFAARLSGRLEVDRSVRVDCAAELSFSKENYALDAQVSLEDIGLYNSDKAVMKPSFSLELTVRNDL